MGDKEWERICNLHFSLFLSKSIQGSSCLWGIYGRQIFEGSWNGSVVPWGPSGPEHYCVCFPNSLARNHSSSQNVVSPSILGFLFSFSLRVFGSVPLWYLYPFLFFCCVTWIGAISSGEKEASFCPDLHQPSYKTTWFLSGCLWLSLSKVSLSLFFDSH